MVLLVALAAIMTMVMVPSYALQPLLVRNEFGGGVNEVAVIETLTGVGMIVGGLVLGAWGGFQRRIVTVLVGSIGLAVGQIVTGAAPTDLFWLAAFGGFISGITISLLNGPIVAIFQTTIPADMQGRVLGLFNSVISLVGPVGLVLTGPLADAVGIRTVYIAGGLIVIAVVLLGFLVPALMTIEEQRQTQST
jgi:DHA3 family macrolide efflux protein-like MFS transporter